MRQDPLREAAPEHFTARRDAAKPGVEVEELREGGLRVLRYWDSLGALIGEVRYDERGRASYYLREHRLADIASSSLRRKGRGSP